MIDVYLSNLAFVSLLFCRPSKKISFYGEKCKKILGRVHDNFRENPRQTQEKTT